MSSNPLDNLAAAADVFRQHHAKYGDLWRNQFGDIMCGLFPRGYTAVNRADWDRLGVLNWCVHKLMRWSATPDGDQDSAHDLINYAAMLEALTPARKLPPEAENGPSQPTPKPPLCNPTPSTFAELCQTIQDDPGQLPGRWSLVAGHVVAWGEARGLHDTTDLMPQTVKLLEEYQELLNAVRQDNELEIQDAIGDMLVVMINLVVVFNNRFGRERCRGVLTDALLGAYQTIQARTGKTVNGVFIKS